LNDEDASGHKPDNVEADLATEAQEPAATLSSAMTKTAQPCPGCPAAWRF